MIDWLPPEFVAKVRARHERLNSPETLARLRQVAAGTFSASACATSSFTLTLPFAGTAP